MRQFGPYLLRAAGAAQECAVVREEPVQPGTGGVVVAAAAGRAAIRGTENRWRQLKREAGLLSPQRPGRQAGDLPRAREVGAGVRGRGSPVFCATPHGGGSEASHCGG